MRPSCIVVEQLAERLVAARDAARVVAAARPGWSARPGAAPGTPPTPCSVAARRRTAASSRAYSAGIVRERVAHVGEAEVDVARLVGARAARELRGRLVGRVLLDEAQQIEERPLAEHRQQERRLGEVLELEQRRAASATVVTRRDAEPPPPARARCRNTSMWRASSASCVARNIATSA